MAARLPAHLPMNEARRQKERLFSSLTDAEIDVIDFLVLRAGTVFGGEGDRVVITPKSRAVRRSTRRREEEEGQVVLPIGGSLRLLERAGGLGWSAGPIAGIGYYWPTVSAEKVWQALGEGESRRTARARW